MYIVAYLRKKYSDVPITTTPVMMLYGYVVSGLKKQDKLFPTSIAAAKAGEC